MDLVRSKRLYINSVDRIGGTSSNFEIIQPNFLNVDEETEFIRVSVLKAVIPYSFYSIVGGVNNIWTIRESDADGITNVNEFFLSFPEGNYNIIQLKTTFAELLALSSSTFTYTITFSTISHKLTISISDVGKQVIFKFTQPYSINKILGYDEADYTFTSSTTSPNVVKLSGEDSVYVKSTLINDGSIDHASGKNSQTLVSIPIRVPHFNLIVYEKNNQEIDDIIITQKHISQFKLFLTDELGNHISLNGLDWQISLLFEVLKKK